MRVLLRCVAVLAGLIGALFSYVSARDLSELVLGSSGLTSSWPPLESCVLGGLGLIGAVELWRFRNRGRLAVMGVVAMIFLVIPLRLILTGAMTVHDWIASWPSDWVSHSLGVAVVVMLTSRTTRALCADVRAAERIDEDHGAA